MSSSLPTSDLENRLCQSLFQHRQMLKSMIDTPPAGVTLSSFLDATILWDKYQMACKIALLPGREAIKYFRSRGIQTYGDLFELHSQIMGNFNPTDPVRQSESKAKSSSARNISQPGSLADSPHFFLGVFDFLPAIHHIPHSPHPEQPTILGLMLSASQKVLRNSDFFHSYLSLHDIMHLLVLHGTLLSGYARTTTGKPVSQFYDIPVPIDHLTNNAEPREGIIGKENILLDDFIVTNAIPLHPEFVILTGYHQEAKIYGHCRPVHIAYNVFESGRGVLLSPPDTENHPENSRLPFTNYPPEFIRQIQKLIHQHDF